MQNLDLKDFFYFFLIISALTVVSFVVVVMVLNSLVSAYNDLFKALNTSLTAKPKKVLVKKTTTITKQTTRKPRVSAKNSQAVNSIFEHQAIKTAEIEIPVIAADVLVYEGGELGKAYPERTCLYYSPEALRDKDFLESVKRSPLQVQTHEKNTGENNRGVDGWPLVAWFDENEKRVKVKGVLHGENNVDYTKENMGKPNFGTSAFISFLKVDREKGVSPEGKPYDAIVRKAVNNHIAILPNVRDPKNVILAMNALDATSDEKAEGTEDKTATNEKNEDNEMSEEMTQEKFNAFMDKYNAKNKEHEDLKNSIKNEILEEMKKGDNAKNGDDKKEEKPVGSDNAKNGDDKKDEDEDKDDASASNALPSEEMVKDFSEALGITFKKTPSLKELGDFAGIEAKNAIELVSALNAKRKELKGSKEAVSATNSSSMGKTLNDVLQEF